MRLSIKGEPVDTWPPDVWGKWHDLTDRLPRDEGLYVAANYFTPRPPRNMFDRGHDYEGFTYTLNGRRVCVAHINQEG